MRSWERFDTDLGRYHASEHVWRFTNGSTIEFGFCESDQDVYQYQSAEYDAIGWDELTQFPTDFPYTYLMSRCRTTVDKRSRGLRPHIVAGTNPGGVGGGWVKERFIDVARPEQLHRHVVKVRGEDREVPRVFIPAKLADNPYLGEEYAMALAGLPPAIRAALQDGSWDVVEGQFFSEWNRSVHVVDPFQIPSSWTRIRAIDYGYAAPMCCLWGAVDGDGNVWIYRELYGPNMTPEIQARTILAMSVMGEGKTVERTDYTVADPSIWTRTGAGPPIQQQYRDVGLPTRKANNARIDGWGRVHEYLRIPKGGQPRVRIFSTCTNLLRTLPMLVHDRIRPEDLDTRSEDHAADCLPAGTPIWTRRGHIPIATVVPDDEVMTRYGWRRVSDAWLQTPAAPLRKITTSDGSVLRATGGHRVWTTRGWVDARDLRYGDMLFRCDTKMSSTGGGPIDGTRTMDGDNIASTTDGSAPAFRTFLSISTAPSGRLRAGRFLPGGMSTIATSIRSTIGSVISNALTRRRTSSNTRGSSSPSRRSANPAANLSSIGRRRAMRGPAPITVGPPSDVPVGRIGNEDSVRGVAGPSSATDTSRPCTVLVSVVSNIDGGTSAVYDLSVEGANEFFASGLLVHNSFRYMLMSRPMLPKGPKENEPSTPDEKHWARVRSRRKRRGSAFEDSPVGRV